VTHGGGKELEEPLVVRPTSETVFGEMYAKWIRSYRDLPLLINQWGPVVRWEKRTRLFLRTTEFLWQEGHTAHATAEEAEAETLQMLDVYADFAENDAALPVVRGRKSQGEKFAGAVDSYAIEAMMGNCWALQAGTSHFLGQNFAKAFDITYLDQNNELQHCWTTSWGVSTRMEGAVIGAHGDDQGLIMPPKLAPKQVVVVPIWRNDEQKSVVMEALERVRGELAGFRVEVDDREGQSPGWKYNEWELKGVPLRVEIGPRDVQKEQVVLARRDVPGRDGKTFVPMAGLGAQVGELLDEIQGALYQRALDFRKDHTVDAKEYGEIVAAVQDHFVLAYWCGDPEHEARLKDETSATHRCIPFEQDGKAGVCAFCGTPAEEKALFARAY
jgi:prolyl-tRNA synthetase